MTKRVNEEIDFWMRHEIAEMRDFIAALESGKKQIRILMDTGDWADVTATEKPNLRERMWNLEKLAKGRADRR